MNKSDQLVRFVETERGAKLGIVTVRARHPFRAETERMNRIQNIHGSRGGGKHLLDFRDFVAGDDFRGDNNSYRRAQWLAAFLFKLRGRDRGFAPQCSGGEKLAEMIARLAADDEETPGAQTSVVRRADRGFKDQPQVRVIRAGFSQCSDRRAG